MSRIEATLKNVGVMGDKALIAYVMAGDPSLDETLSIVFEMEKAGADIIEIGIPFSDPIADGPTIQQAADRALQKGVTLTKVLDLVKTLRRQTKIPLILMTYCNPIYAFGLENFFKAARRNGVNGIIIPDLPIEEARDFIHQGRKHLIDLIFLVAPTTPPERIEKILKAGSGFVYYVPVTGVTGTTLKDWASISQRISALKEMTDRPVAAGFGISSPEEASKIAGSADGIIVGSALVRIIATAPDNPNYLAKLSDLITSLKKAISK
ncbi:MAG: tryptophan synthase subunit alpha [Nitrospiria bacterium]